LAEPGLSLAYDDYRQGIGYFLGFGRTIVDWSTDQSAEIAVILDAGLRNFYTPDPLPGQRLSHQWSFLRVASTLSIESGIGDYDLPDDFGSLDGPLTYLDSNSPNWMVQVTSDKHVMSLRSEVYTNQTSHRPNWAAVRSKRTPHTDISTRWEILFAPISSQPYDLHFRYHVLPEPISSTNRYPYGGQAHSETVMESCLALAEQRMDDQAAIHSQKFIQRLAASIRYDRQTTQADTIGYNRDGSDGSSHSSRRVQRITVGGVTPD